MTETIWQTCASPAAYIELSWTMKPVQSSVSAHTVAHSCPPLSTRHLAAFGSPSASPMNVVGRAPPLGSLVQ